VSNFDRFSLGGTLRFPVTGDAKRSEMSQPYGSMPASPTVDSELRPTVHLSQHARRRPLEIRAYYGHVSHAVWNQFSTGDGL